MRASSQGPASLPVKLRSHYVALVILALALAAVIGFWL